MKPFKYNFIACMIVLLTAVISPAFAQQVVTGKVTDSNKAPIIGATIVVKGTSVGTTTDMTGKYSIKLTAKSGNVLIFNSIGYNEIEKTVNTAIIDVVMTESAEVIDDVVVIGYGTVRKSDLTGSVSTVKFNSIEASQVGTFDKLLQGRAAGVQVTTGSSAPGGAVNIKIRGTSSFNGSGEPLYIVDGVILNPSSQDVSNPISSTGQESQNGLTSINAADIESMEILKDASATAIYGSMGANGIVMITTKSGKTDRPKIEWSSNVDISTPYKKMPLLDLGQFIQYADAVGYKSLNADTLSAVDWQDYTMRTGISQSHRVSISGKNKNSTYYIAAGYMNNQGILKNTDVTQGDIRVNFDQKIGKYVKIGTKTTLTDRNNNMTQGTEPGGTQNATRATNMMRQMLGSKPYLISPDAVSFDDEDSKGTEIWLQNYDDLSKEYRINTMAYVDIAFTKWLSFKSTFGGDYRNKSRTRWYGQYIDNAKNGRGGYSELNSFRYNIDNVFSFNKEFNKTHRINAIIGMSLNNAFNKNSTIDAQDFPDHEFRAAGIYSARNISPNYSEDRSALASFFARAIYSYKDRYVFTGSIRADGSSKFSSQNKFSYFPSFALAWRISEEKFMKNIEQISSLKLRLGWGLVGNQGLSPYQTLTMYNSINMASPTSNYISTPDGSFIIGVKPAILANENLVWETTNQYNIGLDLGMFDNRLTASLDLYKKNSKDLLQEIAIPLSVGFESMWVNRGNIENRGLELTIDGVIIDNKKFSWSLGGNISFNRNKIVNIGLPSANWGTIVAPAFLGDEIGNDATYFKMPANIFIESRPVALFYGFRTDGIVQQSDVDAGDLPTYREKPLVAGDIKYVDVDHSGNIDDKDKTIIGDPNPKFVFGFNTSFTYKNLSLSMAFNGVYGNQIVNGNRLQEDDTSPANPAQNINNIRSEAFFKAWTPENTNTSYPRLRKTNNSGDFTDRIVEDGSYLRLSNVTLSYNFPMKNVKWISNIGISFTARNLFVITNYSGWDPDVSSFTNNSQKVGVDWGSYPSTRGYVVGLNVTF